MLSDQNKAKSLGEKMFDAVITVSGEPNTHWNALPSDVQILFEQASVMFLDAAREEGRQSAGGGKIAEALDFRIEEERAAAESYPLGDPRCTRHGGVRDGLKEARALLAPQAAPADQKGAEACPICRKLILAHESRATGYFGGAGDGMEDAHDRCASPDVSSPLEVFWARMLETDDRNSPEEYPEMILVTYDEVKRAMQEAVQASLAGDQKDGAS